MAEFFTEAQLALLSASTVRVDFLVKFEFASDTMYVWNGNTPLTVDGHEWLPMYGFGTIEGLGLSAGSVSEVITLTLDGLPGMPLDFLSKALADTSEVQQRMVTVYMQLFAGDNDPELEAWQPSGTPIPLFRGFAQPPKVSRSAMQGTEGATQSITLDVENIFYGRARPPHGRNTDRDQQARSLGDKFFGFVSSIVSKTVRYPDF